MSEPWLRALLLPLAGAFIGYFTNAVAIWMLFRPRREVRFGGIRLPLTPGLIPKEKPRLAEAVGEAVARELLTSQELVELLRRSPLKRTLVEAVDDMVEEKLAPLRVPEAARFEAKLFLGKHVVRQVDRVLQEYGPRAAEGMDVRQLVREKLDAMELGELERLVWRVSGRQLRYIKWAGAALGLLLGALEAAWLGLAG